MSINKSISYLLCNKGIIVNLYKLYFSSFLFSLLPNKRVFHSLTFPPFQPNTQEGKVNIFYPPTFPSSHNFLSSHFSIPLTKQTLRVHLVGGVEKWKDGKLFCLVGEKNERMENIVYIN